MTMDIRNKLPQAANTTVKVNGNVYEIDRDGVARNVAEADAKKLLTMGDWVPHTDRKPVARPVEPQPKPEPKKPTPEPKPAPQEAPGASEEPEDEPEPEEAQDEPEEDQEDGEEEWPDPTMSMTKAYLQEMAEAYGVDHDGMTKQGLVDAIMEKMYPDGQ